MEDEWLADGGRLRSCSVTRRPRNAAYLEEGSKRIFAVATEWPGWARAGKTREAALATLTEYSPRYRKVANLAGVEFQPRWFEQWNVVETVAGSGGTDFGVPEKVTEVDRRSLTGATAQRWADLLLASWQHFEEIADDASAFLRKGPRGGGRDRDTIRAHILESEESYGTMVGIPRKADVANRRAQLIEMIRKGGSEPAKWPLRYAVRRVAWHCLDHAWEIEDRSH